MFDSRHFGVFVLAGIHISNISQFMFHPMTSQERELGLSKDTRSSLGTDFRRGVIQNTN